MTTYKITAQPTIDPVKYTPLLSTIAKGESHGNYNAYYGNSTNNVILFTDMKVSDVLQWQADFVRQGNASSAVGKYQIIRPTLEGLVAELGINKDTRFDSKLQDTLAITLLERRGALDYAHGKIDRRTFAANIAKEWAALPRAIGPNPEESYYAADGINKSRITIDEVYASLATLTF